MKLEDIGIKIGSLPKGRLNQISDVKGIKVGHFTIDDKKKQTGVTVIIPCDDNIYANPMVASSYVLNGFGKSIGLLQVEELGEIESPIVLTNTLSVGSASHGLVQYIIEENKKQGIDIKSFNPIVCECNDSKNNDIASISVKPEHVKEAISSARDMFEEGSVGAGRGMRTHGLKGGIGSSSRQIKLCDKRYTVGTLVMSNHGRLEDLTIANKNIGVSIKKTIEKFEKSKDGSQDVEDIDTGSIIIIMATDIPLTSRQIKRVLKRASVGLARVGSHLGHGSGDVFIGFSTANRMDRKAYYQVKKPNDALNQKCIQENQYIQDYKLDIVFRAFIESVEEAVINSMLQATKLPNLEVENHLLREYIDVIS